jgi:hypothetical protein
MLARLRQYITGVISTLTVRQLRYGPVVVSHVDEGGGGLGGASGRAGREVVDGSKLEVTSSLDVQRVVRVREDPVQAVRTVADDARLGGLLKELGNLFYFYFILFEYFYSAFSSCEL